MTPFCGLPLLLTLKGRVRATSLPPVEKPLDTTTRRMYTLVAWVSFLTIVAVLVYGVVQSLLYPNEPVGYWLVNVEWPFAYFAKPVSYFSIASVALFYSGLRLWEERILRWPKSVLYSLQLIGFVVAFDSAYEVIYNFIIWGAIFSSYCSRVAFCAISPDSISTVFSQIPWSLDFATKAFSALFVISGYSVYFIRRLTKNPLI